jgi:hypothetical protein
LNRRRLIRRAGDVAALAGYQVEVGVFDAAGSDQVDRRKVVIVTLPEVAGPSKDNARRY